MQNARSLLGRFSGLALFLLALLVVGLLVIFTVRSANDNDLADNSGMTSSEGTEKDQPVAIPDLDSQPQVTDTSATDERSGSVAGDQDGLPNTGAGDVIIPAVVIALVVWQIARYRDSRHLLVQTTRQA